MAGTRQWSPNEKVALEVAIGAAFGGARALATMKHVGLNVASDPLFTAAYTGVTGALVIVSADDPGMASSQNEQDNRRYAVAAGVPMLEPSDSQEAYDFMLAAMEISERWNIPVLLRVTTRVCHSYTVVQPRGPTAAPPAAGFRARHQIRVMIPAYARPAHRRLRQKLAEIADLERDLPAQPGHPGQQSDLGIITSGISFMHVREAAPDASVLKLGFTYPLPMKKIAEFAKALSAAWSSRKAILTWSMPSARRALPVEGKAEMYRFGELDVAARAPDPEPATSARNRPSRRANRPSCAMPASTASSSRRCASATASWPATSAVTRWACCSRSRPLTPASAWAPAWASAWACATCCPPDQARRVVSVIGDSTFVHSGISGLVEMVYNPPPDGHVLIILDNSTTAMTGHQEHPGTGRKLNHEPTDKLVLEDLARALGIKRVYVVEPRFGSDEFESCSTNASRATSCA